MVASHIVIDLETFGTDDNAQIVEIGAAAIVDNKIASIFYKVITLPENFKVNKGTIKWWVENNFEAFRSVFEDQKELMPIEKALKRLNEWLEGVAGPQTKYVGNGPTFDLVILKNAYEKANVPYYLNFRNYRDLRTYVEIFKAKMGYDPKDGETAHRANLDARDEALMLCKILKDLKI